MAGVAAETAGGCSRVQGVRSVWVAQHGTDAAAAEGAERAAALTRASRDTRHGTHAPERLSPAASSADGASLSAACLLPPLMTCSFRRSFCVRMQCSQSPDGGLTVRDSGTAASAKAQLHPSSLNAHAMASKAPGFLGAAGAGAGGEQCSRAVPCTESPPSRGPPVSTCARRACESGLRGC